MDLTALLLLVAFRHRIKEADIGAGIATFETIIGRKLDEGEFPGALAPSPGATFATRCACCPGRSSATGTLNSRQKASTPFAPCFVTLIRQQCHQ